MKSKLLWILLVIVIIIIISLAASIILAVNLNTIMTVTEILAYIAFIFAAPWAIFEYINTKNKEQQDRDYGTYDALDEKFIDFQKFCLERSYLDIFDIPDIKPRKLNKKEEKEELIAFTILFSIFERAYLMYYDEPSEIRKNQWQGWKEYIGDYCERDNFRRAWEAGGSQFEERFQNFMKRQIAKVGKKPKAG